MEVVTVPPVTVQLLSEIADKLFEETAEVVLVLAVDPG